MTSIGESLRQERQRRDLGLEQISRELKIAPRFLQAIEEERFEKLPGGVFAKSFVRQYARYLGLDEDEYAAAVQQAVEPRPASNYPTAPAVPPLDITLPRVEGWQSVGNRHFQWSSSLPALAMVVIAMLVCSGVYTWWQRHRVVAVNAEKAQAADTVQASRPKAPQPLAAVPSAPPSTSSNEVAAATPPPAAPGDPPAEPAPSQSSANRPAPAVAAPAPATQADAAAPAGAVKVEISATEPVWVLARADGKYAFSGTIDANQSRTVEAKGTLTIRLGNAGGANITLNGKPIGPVGPKGEVRTIQFTSGGFQIVAAPKPSAPPLDPLL